MTSISSSTFNVSSYTQTQGTSGAHGPGRHKPDFSKIDTDGSGGLSQSEFQTMIQNAPQRPGSSSETSGTSSTADASTISDLFSKTDTDGDGSISEAELEAGRPKDDSSNNGLSQMGLSTSDFAQMMGMQGGMQMQGPPPGPPPGSSDSDSDSDASSAFSAIDTDSDGSISKSEFLASLDSSSSGTSSTSSTSSTDSTSSSSSTSASDQLSKLFDAIDGDGSGSLSSSEVSDFRKKMQDIFGSLNQQMQAYGNQQYQWFSQDASGGSASSQSISYNA